MQRAFLLLVLLAAAVGGLFWFLSRADSRETAERGAPASPSASAPADAGRPVLTAPDVTPPEEQSTAAAELAPREVVTTERDRELAAARWIEGRVLFPADTPAEERVRVIAKGRAFEHGPEHSVEVGPDGRFRVAFAPKTRTGRLSLEATWLYLEEPVKVSLAGAPAPVELEARLGGLVRGRIIPPPGTDPALLVGREVTLWGRRRQQMDSWGTSIMLSVEVGPDLDYEFTALPADGRYEVECDPEIYMPALVEDFPVEPGGEVRYDLELLEGVTLAGLVVDEASEPVGRAAVHVEVGGDFSWSDAHNRAVLSEADGTFRLTGVAPGDVELLVSAKGYEDTRETIGRLSAARCATG